MGKHGFSRKLDFDFGRDTKKPGFGLYTNRKSFHGTGFASISQFFDGRLAPPALHQRFRRPWKVAAERDWVKYFLCQSLQAYLQPTVLQMAPMWAIHK